MMEAANSGAATRPATTQAQPMRLSVLLPVFSETQCLIDTVHDVRKYAGPYLHEILLIVSPKSIPETFRICDGLAAAPDVRQRIQVNNPGIGWAVREGFEMATGSHVLLMASDGETDPSIIPEMIRTAERTHCDIVTANRWHSTGGFQGYEPMKLVLNWIFQRFFKLVLRTSASDLTYGYRLFETGLVQRIRWEYTMHEFLFETIAKPIRLGCRIEEVPVKWMCRPEGSSKNTFFRNFHYFRVGLRAAFSNPKTFLRSADGNDV